MVKKNYGALLTGGLLVTVIIVGIVFSFLNVFPFLTAIFRIAMAIDKTFLITIAVLVALVIIVKSKNKPRYV